MTRGLLWSAVRKDRREPDDSCEYERDFPATFEPVQFQVSSLGRFCTFFSMAEQNNDRLDDLRSAETLVHICYLCFQAPIAVCCTGLLHCRGVLSSKISFACLVH